MAEKIESALPQGPAGSTGAEPGPDGTLRYHDISGKDLGSVPGDGGGSDSIDLSAGMVPKQGGLDLSAGMVPRESSAPSRMVDPNQMGNAVVDAAKGFGKGVLQTTSGLGELIHKIPVIGPKIIPAEGLAAEENMSEPKGLAEHLGAFGENVAEYASGEEALAGLSRFAKLEQLAQKSPAIANFLNKTPAIVKKVVSGATKGAVVGGAQGGVKGAAEGDAVGGAEGGAIGGGAGAAAGEIASAVAGPVLKKVGLGTSDSEDIMRAAKPGKRNDRFLADWDIAKERYAKELDENGKYENLTDAAERMRDIRQDLWKTEVKPKIDAHAGEDMFAVPPGTVQPTQNPVARAIRARVTPAMSKVSPSSAKAIETFAKRFDGPMKVGEAEELAEHINAELQDTGYWKKSASERAAADKANPAMAARSAAVDAIRSELADHLEAAGEPDIKELKRTYGAMSNVEREVRGQVNVASRQAPLSLKQIIAFSSGHPVGMAAAMVDKIWNDPVSILNRGVKKAGPDGAVKAAAKDLARGAGTVASKAIPAGGAAAGSWVKIQAGDGKTYEVHPEDVAELQKRDPDATPIQ